MRRRSVRAVAGLGLGGYDEYQLSPRPGGPDRRRAGSSYAVIDVGTNSVKFHIGERDARWDVAHGRRSRRNYPPRRGAGADTADRRRRARSERPPRSPAWSTRQGSKGVRAIAAVGTAGLRIAANGAEVVAAIQRAPAFRSTSISGDDEGRLAYLATMAALGIEAGLARRVRHRRRQFASSPSGMGRTSTSASASMSAPHATPSGSGSTVPCRKQMLREAMAAISADLARLDGRPAPDALVGMGGAVTNITAVRHGLATYDPVHRPGYDPRPRRDRPPDRALPLAQADARRSIVGLQPNRAEVILAGACIVRTVMEKLGKDQPDGERPRSAPRCARGAVRNLSSPGAEGPADRMSFSGVNERVKATIQKAGKLAIRVARAKPAMTPKPVRSAKTARSETAERDQSACKPGMIGEDMLKVFELLKGATSVELKLTVPRTANQPAAIQRLGFDPVEAEPRQAYFFDTPDLALNRAGVVVRARKNSGRRRGYGGEAAPG